MNTENKKKVDDALNTYYKLKSAYENSFNKEKRKIIVTPGLGWKEKRIMLSKLKPKCINCKRPVKTLFSITNNRDEMDRTLSAKCGDRQNPCSLDIRIYLGFIININEELLNNENDIAIIKKNIIIDKNNLNFGYITSSDAVEKFDEIKERFSKTTAHYEYFLQTYMNIVDNKEEKKELIKDETELYDQIMLIKQMITDFNKTKNVQLIEDVVDIYIKNIITKNKSIMGKKYAYTNIEYDKSDDIFKLIQLPLTIDNLEWGMTGDADDIISIKFGIDKTLKKTKKRSIESGKSSEFKITIPKKKTLKNKNQRLNPQLKLSLDESEEDSNEEKEGEKKKEKDSDSDSDSDSD